MNAVEILNNWKLRCPIKRLKESLIEANILDQLILDNIRHEIINEINHTWKIALEEPLPEKAIFKKYLL